VKSREEYETERRTSTGPVDITIRTHVPDKWRFVDLETGDVWKWVPTDDGSDDRHFVLVAQDYGRGGQ